MVKKIKIYWSVSSVFNGIVGYKSRFIPYHRKIHWHCNTELFITNLQFRNKNHVFVYVFSCIVAYFIYLQLFHIDYVLTIRTSIISAKMLIWLTQSTQGGSSFWYSNGKQNPATHFPTCRPFTKPPSYSCSFEMVCEININMK